MGQSEALLTRKGVQVTVKLWDVADIVGKLRERRFQIYILVLPSRGLVFKKNKVKVLKNDKLLPF